MSQITIRGMDGADLGAIVRIARISLPADPVTPEGFARKVFLDQNFDRRGCLVAEDPVAGVVGFVVGHIRKHPIEDMPDDSKRSWIPLFAVHPEHQHRGVGSRLFEAVENWFQTEKKEATLIGPYTPNWWTPGVDVNAYTDALGFLSRRGYVEAMRPLSMDAPLISYVRPAWITERHEKLLKEGVRFEVASLEVLPALFDFLLREFPGDWQRHVREVCNQTLASGNSVIRRVRVAIEGTEEVVGFTHHDGERFGPFGTARAVRGRGIGAALLAQTIEDMRAQGLHAAYFMWTDDTAARLYSEVGFRESRRFSLMKKDWAK